MGSYDKAKAAMSDAEKSVTKYAGNAVSSFAAAGVAVTTFVAAANIGIAKFLSSIAKADLENQKFARQMWTTEENAKSLKTSLDSMGASLQDLYYSPELLQNFMKLRQQATRMGPPDEYKSQMKYIRSIGFEFQRLKLEANYAMQWIGYYIFKYLEAPIKQFKVGIKGVNDTIEKSMPQWTKQVAQIISWFGRLGIAAVKAGEAIGKLFKSLPQETKIAGSAMLGFFTLLKMGPIGWIIAGLTGILLLLDDFTTYKNGGESALGWLWKDLESKKGLFAEDGPIGILKSILESIWETLTKIGKDFIEGLDWNKTKDNLGELGLALLGIVNSLTQIVKMVADTGVFVLFGKIVGTVFKGLTEAVKAIRADLEFIVNTFKIGPVEALKKFKGDMVANWDKGKKENPEEWSSLTSKLNPFIGYNEWIRKNDPIGNFIKDLGGYAEGGRITSPTIAKIGEGGNDEFVIPINQTSRAMSLWRQAGEALGALRSNPYAQQMAYSKVDHIYPTTNVTSKTSISLSPTYKIYGSEPTLTARAVERSNDAIIMRNLQGVLK